MENKTPPIIKLSKVLLYTLIALFVLFAVLCAVHIEAKWIYYVLIVLILADGIATVAVRFGPWYGKAEKGQKEAEIEHQKEEAKSKGEIYCTKEQFEAIRAGYGSMDKNNLLTNCPVCGEPVVNDDEYEMNKVVWANEAVKGVYVGNSYSNQVTQAYQTVQRDKTFPAIVGYCPHCEWKMHISKYTEYTSDGDPYSSGMCGRDFMARYFLSGKLYIKNMPKGMDEHWGGCRFTKKVKPAPQKSDWDQALETMQGIQDMLNDALEKAKAEEQTAATAEPTEVESVETESKEE